MKTILIYLSYSYVWLIILGIIAFIAMIYFIFRKPEDNNQDDIITSNSLRNEMNAERRSMGLEDMPEINNTCCISTGNLARKDKSFSSVPDFFIKLFKKDI